MTGLTSAASIWVTAAIGVIAGCGLWQVAIVATVMMMILCVWSGGIGFESSQESGFRSREGRSERKFQI